MQLLLILPVAIFAADKYTYMYQKKDQEATETSKLTSYKVDDREMEQVNGGSSNTDIERLQKGEPTTQKPHGTLPDGYYEGTVAKTIQTVEHAD